MDNVVGQENIRNNVAEEEVISCKNEQKDAGERKEVVEGEDSVPDNTISSTATQKDVAVGDKSSTTDTSAIVANVPIDISTSPKNSIDTFQSLPTSPSDPYKTAPPETLTSTINTSKLIVPKRIVRIERDYSRGEMCQFRTTFPIEIEGRVIL
ncbi:508_t:CDS:1 [Racocetra fulgida]|uniref:508_t:CDS:1 n=1 Tax=Racocetra fulgida TaxID=60492 RepID=A0A9N9DNL1_9GLOM|nr:508_t:CDS:1 [Racocetra fulgida]